MDIGGVTLHPGVYLWDGTLTLCPPFGKLSLKSLLHTPSVLCDSYDLTPPKRGGGTVPRLRPPLCKMPKKDWFLSSF